MKKLTRSKIQEWVREEISNVCEEPELLEDRDYEVIINESFTTKERRELATIIRNEIARLFYDLYRKRSFWKK